MKFVFIWFPSFKKKLLFWQLLITFERCLELFLRKYSIVEAGRVNNPNKASRSSTLNALRSCLAVMLCINMDRNRYFCIPTWIVQQLKWVLMLSWFWEKSISCNIKVKSVLNSFKNKTWILQVLIKENFPTVQIYKSLIVI